MKTENLNKGFCTELKFTETCYKIAVNLESRKVE